MLSEYTPHSTVVRDCQSWRESCDNPSLSVVKAASGAKLTIEDIEKLDPAISEPVAEWRAKLLRKTGRSESAAAKPAFIQTGKPASTSNRITLQTSIAKVDEDRRLVYLWASVASEDNGQTLLIDKQGDIITEAELENAAVEHMLYTDQDGDCMHDGCPVTQLVGSMVFTSELKKALGIETAMPRIGWLVCYKVLDDDIWARVKTGELAMGSIEATAERHEVSA